MPDPTTLGDGIQQTFGAADRSEIDELLEKLGVEVDDPGLTARAMDTAEQLVDSGLPGAAKAYVCTMLANPDLLNNPIRHKCRCNRGGVFTGPRTVTPCPRCNSAQHSRSTEDADKDYQLGDRTHLDHADNPKACGFCRRTHQLGEDTDSPETWR